jgi:hypothetical protein
VDEAIAEYREAISIQKDFPEAHCNLGNALRVRRLRFPVAPRSRRLA